MEEAINQLQDLGVSRIQAKKALARYNNDVARAADYIFSGSYISDEEEEVKLIEEEKKSEALAISLSLEEEKRQKKLAHSTATTSHSTTTNNSNLSLVLYKGPQETSDQVTPSYDDSNQQTTSDFSLTWWTNPENPSHRKATNNL
ncbi:hypothetical protein G6F43_012415 [Rhizopus delemar]|nr:hypothetical protein G6F43_012415 [Rhizopus delemar]